MKTLEEILKSEPVFYGQWKNKEDVFASFELEASDYPEHNILFAVFEEDNYPSQPYVLFEKGGKLYEVHAHDTSWGLGEQFEPEDVALEYTKKWVIDLCSGDFTARKLKKFLNIPLSEEEMKAEYEQTEVGINERLDREYEQTKKEFFQDAIFIQIAAYRDPELKSTIRDCIAKANRPEKLHFVIAWQHSERDAWDELDEFTGCKYTAPRRPETLYTSTPMMKDRMSIDIIDIPHTESKGCCWARNLIQQEYRGEEYSFQIDSHMRFTKGWDTTLIVMNKQLKALGHKKPILTGYIGDYDIGKNRVPANILQDHYAKSEYLKKEKNHSRDMGACYMQYNGFNKEGWVEFRPSYIPNWETLDTPVHARFYSANFAFSDGSLCTEVQHDPEYLFHGEEISIAVRAYTHGYDWFHPHKAVVWHQYNREGRTYHWVDKPQWWTEMNEISLRRNRILLGVDGEDHSQINFGKYGLGTARTLEDYEKYTGVNFRARRFAHSTHEAEERFLFGK